MKETTDGVSSESLAMASAAKLLEDKGVEPKWNDGYGSHYGEFKQDGAVYKIWLENEKSRRKMKVIYEADVVMLVHEAWFRRKESLGYYRTLFRLRQFNLQKSDGCFWY